MSNATLDRDLLHDAIDRCSAEKLYAWSTSLKTPPKLSSVGIRNIGEVTLPLDVERLRELCNRLTNPRKPDHCGPVVVKDFDLYKPKSQDNSYDEIFNELAKKAVGEMFNIDTQDFSFNIHAVLDKLVICYDDSLYRGIFNIEKEPGTFGSLILQVPLHGVVGGAHIKVQYDKETMIMEHDVCSGTNYYLTAVAGRRINDADVRQEFVIKAATKWHCVLLIANLIWLDAVDSLPKVDADRFPQFIEAACEANRALSSWRYVTQKNTADKKKDGEVFCANIDVTDTSEQSVERKLPLLNASQTTALCIPMRGNYCLENYNIQSLTGDDALISRVLSSVSYLTVDLVLVNKMKYPPTDWKQSALLKSEEIVHVFKPISKEHVEQVPVTLTTGENFAGNLTSGITCLKFGVEKCSSCTAQQPCQYFYAAFLIRPKYSQIATEKPKYFDLNCLIYRSPKVERYEGAFNYVNDLNSKDTRKMLIDSLTAAGWEKWKRTTVYGILVNSHLSRTFHGLTLLAVDCCSMKCNEGLACITSTMVEFFAYSVRNGASRTALPHLNDMMKAFEIIAPNRVQFVEAIKKATDCLTAAHSATIIEQMQSAGDARYLKDLGRLLLEKSFKDLTQALLFGAIKTFTNFNDMETVTNLWRKVCDEAKSNDGQLLRSIVMNPKEDAAREALVVHLASFAQFTKQALDAVVENMKANADITPGSLTELFLFLLVAESNESLANQARVRNIFAFLFRVELEILCQVPKKLCQSPLLEQTHIFEVLKALIKAMINDYFQKILNLPSKEIVTEFIESIFYLRNEELINLTIEQIVLLDRSATICFQSSSFNRYVIDLLQGSEKIDEKTLIPLTKLWILNVYEFSKTFGLSGSTLSKALFYCFPDCDAELSDSFKKLLSNSNPSVLANFVKGIGEKIDVTKENGLPFANVLLVAFNKLIDERSFLTMAPPEKMSSIVKVAACLGDKSTISRLSQFSTLQKQSNTSKQDEMPNKMALAPIEEIRKPLPPEDASLRNANKTVQKVGNRVEASQESWAFQDIRVPENKKLERFIQSDRQSEIFGRCETNEEAPHLRRELNLLVNRFQLSDLMRVVSKQQGAMFICILVKKHKSSSYARVINEKNTKYNAAPMQHRRVPDADAKHLPPEFAQVNVTETWRIEDAVFPSNRAFEKFLRSNLRSRTFPARPLRSLQLAQRFSNDLIRKSPWPIHVEVNVMSHEEYLCHVTKAAKTKLNAPGHVTVAHQSLSYPINVVPLPSSAYPAHNSSHTRINYPAVRGSNNQLIELAVKRTKTHD